jgi:N-acetylmuramoyl-L-alanine amidase
VITRRLLLGRSAIATFAAPTLSAHADSLPLPPRPPAGGAGLPLVMLDAGHGGKDPGAIGLAGTFEKHVALASAEELKRQLEASGRYRVVLSRSRDVFIPLEGRVELAQKHDAALFVSMHADAMVDHEVRGASVYTLADAASDAQTEALAQRENASDRFAGPEFEATSPEVARILASLVRQETRLGSARMARNVVAALGHDLPLLPKPSRHAGFVVLKAPDIPSVLVEMGFISNPEDEAALRREEHRALIAAALHRAIDAYFAEVGPLRPTAARTAG